MLAPTLKVVYNASGAAAAAAAKDIVVIVDVISMSTTVEGLLEQGAIAVFGASPDLTRAPVVVNPAEMGYQAGRLAVQKQTEVLLVSEPRVGTDAQRMAIAQKALDGLQRAGATLGGVLPNVGAEAARLVDARNKVILAVSDTGGVAFDAAWQAGAPAVITGTIARTLRQRSREVAILAAERAIALARRHQTGIAVVAASANALEDVLAAEYLARVIAERGFLQV